MTETIIPWLLSTVVCIAVGAVVFYRQGPGLAVGCGLALACFVPTWVAYWVGNVPIDVRLSTASVLMLAYCFHPQGQIRSTVNVIDIAIGAMVIWHAVVDCSIDGFHFMVPFRAYGEWALPYVCGRFAVMHLGSVSRLAVWFTTIAILIGAFAVIESATRMNAWELVFGHADDLVQRGNGERYGSFYRAMGPIRHPIGLGCILVLMTPWAISLVSSQGETWRRVMGCAGVVFIILGIMASGSRGPFLALLIATGTALGFYYIWVRRIIAGMIIVGAILSVAFWSSILEFADRIEPNASATVVELNGEFQRRSSTRARLLVVEVYAPLVIRGGLLGFGTEAVRPVPPIIPGLPSSARTRESIRVVENAYLLVGLRFGLIGGFLFVVIVLSSTIVAFFAARNQSLATYPDQPVFLVAIGSIFVGMSFELLTIPPAYDMFFWHLFLCGIVSGLAALDTKIRRGEVAID